MSPDTIGWIASGVLVATLLRQIYTQWKDDSAKGVSRWLFVGQMAASVGFILYSWLLRNWVFIVTNTIILLTAVLGEVVVWLKQNRK